MTPAHGTLTRLPALLSCPNATIWKVSCKARSCPFCGPKWARDVAHVMRENLAAYGGPVVMVSITPPGADDGLPWDEEHCAHRRPHRHSGPKGCRVELRRAREWNESAVDRMSELRRAANAHVRRTVGIAPTFLDRVWEPQRRGVAHWHGVFGVATFQERRAAQEFVAYLKAELEVTDGLRLSRARYHGFGHVDGHLKPLSAQEAARYLSAYLTGRNKHKPSMRESLISPALTALDGRRVGPRRWPIFWVTPKLTRRTFVTMRTLRRARHFWAAVRNVCDPPAWASATEAVKVGVVYRRVYGRDSDVDADEALRLAAALEQAGERLKTIRNPFGENWDVPVRCTIGWRDQLTELVRTIAQPSVDDRELLVAA